MGWFAKLLGGGVLGTVERIATELIETDMESAEAKTLLIKTIDPNGLMRRQLSKFASRAYGFYLVMATVLIFLQFFAGENGSEAAMNAMTSLFLPITTAWGTIVTASFGVNSVNAFKNN